MIKKITIAMVLTILSTNSYADYIEIVSNEFEPTSELKIVGKIEPGCGPTTGTGCYILTNNANESYYLSRMRDGPDLSAISGKIVTVYGQPSIDKMGKFRLFNKNFNLFIEP